MLYKGYALFIQQALKSYRELVPKGVEVGLIMNVQNKGQK